MGKRVRFVETSAVKEIHESSNDLTYWKLVHAEVDGGDLSVTSVEIAGKHRRLKTDASTRVYYILSGDFVFSIQDEEPIYASNNDVLVVYPSSEYEFVGTGKYLVINGPAFRDGDDQYTLSETSINREQK